MIRVIDAYERQTFCDTCENWLGYLSEDVITERDVSTSIDGVKRNYINKFIICPSCGTKHIISIDWSREADETN